jgi:hypothetical protein
MIRSSTRRSGWTRLVALLLGSVAASMVACGDDPSGPEGPFGPEGPVGTDAVQQAPQGLFLSGPGGGGAVFSGAATTSGDFPLAYVSARPGTFPDATSIEIRNSTTGYSGTPAIPVIDGGFDPVAVRASAGDELELDVLSTDGQLMLVTLTVPEERPPLVVRTDPPKGRTDVAFSARPLVIFTEPIDSSSLDEASVQLLRDGTPLTARVDLVPESPFAARVVPDSPLEPSTTYELVVTTAVRDLDGDALENDVRVTFTTRQLIATISIVSGDGQTGRVGEPLADSFVVRVTDVDGSALENVLVVWESALGALDGFAEDGAPIDTLSTRTDANGLASASLVPTIFSQATTYARLELCAGGTCGSRQVEFTADTRDPGATLNVVSGDNQSADAGQASAPLVVRMTDGQGDPVQHVGVTWQRTFGSGTFSPCADVGCKAVWAEAWTDADGLAQVSFVPLWFGLVGIEARYDGAPGPSVFFEIDASDPGASITIVSGDGQVGKANEELAEPLVVRVTNGRGEPVERVGVEWSSLAWGSSILREFHWWQFPHDDSRGLIAGLDSVYYMPRAAGDVWAEARLPGLPTRAVRFTAEATAFVIELRPDPGCYASPCIIQGPYFYGNLLDPDCLSCVGENNVGVGKPLEWVMRVPSGRIVSTSVPPGGNGFDSGTLSENARFTFVPNVAGTWEYVDQVSGATGVLRVY